MVLVIDDYPPMGHVLKKLLATYGIPVQCVYSAAEAWEVLRGIPPDVILLDDAMPNYPHDQTLQLFRAFFLKNLAMAQRDTGDAAGFESSLAMAAKCFEVVQREAEWQLANAYTGSASIPALRGDGRKALGLINSALKLVPDHPYAKHDREEIRRVFKM